MREFYHNMICLHRLKGEEFFLNHRHIETIEKTPDTVITLVNEHKYLVCESADQIRALIQGFEKEIFDFSSHKETEE